MTGQVSVSNHKLTLSFIAPVALDGIAKTYDLSDGHPGTKVNVSYTVQLSSPNANHELYVVRGPKVNFDKDGKPKDVIFYKTYGQTADVDESIPLPADIIGQGQQPVPGPSTQAVPSQQVEVKSPWIARDDPPGVAPPIVLPSGPIVSPLPPVQAPPPRTTPIITIYIAASDLQDHGTVDMVVTPVKVDYTNNVPLPEKG